MLPPDVRLQLAAITLAEELNFTRAAARLKITQPALSKQIAELENRIGFAVFNRNQKGVKLTDAGQVFICGCRDASAILEKPVLLARPTQDQGRPFIAIGHCPYVDPALISAILSTHLPLYSNLRLRMESMFALDLAHSIFAAELDLSVIAKPSGNPHLTLVELATVPLCVVMPADHPAARRGRVCIEEFANVGWMIFPRKAHPVIYDRIPDVSRQAAVSPIELDHYVTPQEGHPDHRGKLWRRVYGQRHRRTDSKCGDSSTAPIPDSTSSHELFGAARRPVLATRKRVWTCISPISSPEPKD